MEVDNYEYAYVDNDVSDLYDVLAYGEQVDEFRLYDWEER